MSTHDYNTSYNFSNKKDKKPAKTEVLKKPSTLEARHFYSEILNPDNVITVTEDNFYVIYDNRKI